MSIITTERLFRLWETAQTKPEWATTRLWEYILRVEVFKGREWTIASQQPPTHDDGDLRRVDMVAEHLDELGSFTQVLFVEAKEGRASPADLIEAESQALTACIAYLHYYTLPRVCAMTCFGGKAKLWYYVAGEDYLSPLVPPDAIGLGAKEEYIEANSTNGHLILDGLKYIRDNRVPPDNILSSKSSPPALANKSLHQDWDTNEVAYDAGESSYNARSEGLVSPAQPEYIKPEDLYFVETWQEGEDFCFRTEKGVIKTTLADWRQGETDYKGKVSNCSFYTGKKSGTTFYTWFLGSLSGDPEGEPTKRKERRSRY